ncbi:hypothetical protein ACFX2I_041360 [Malus domestica]
MSNQHPSDRGQAPVGSSKQVPSNTAARGKHKGERGGVEHTRSGASAETLHTISTENMAKKRSKEESGRREPTKLEELKRSNKKLGRTNSRYREKRRRKGRRGHSTRPQPKLGPVPPKSLEEDLTEVLSQQRERNPHRGKNSISKV